MSPARGRPQPSSAAMPIGVLIAAILGSQEPPTQGPDQWPDTHTDGRPIETVDVNTDHL